MQISLKFVSKGQTDNDEPAFGSGNGLASNRRLAIYWTNAEPLLCRIYAALVCVCVRPSDAMWHHKTRSTLVWAIVCRLLGANPLHEPMLTYCQLDPSLIFEFWAKEPFTKMLLKYHLRHGSQFSCLNVLTHWGRVTHICVSKLTIIGSDNGLSPGRRQAIFWTNAGILLIEPSGTNFSEIGIGIQTFSFKKLYLKMSSGKWRPSCLGLNVLKPDRRSTCIIAIAHPLSYNICSSHTQSTMIDILFGLTHYAIYSPLNKVTMVCY